MNKIKYTLLCCLLCLAAMDISAAVGGEDLTITAKPENITIEISAGQQSVKGFYRLENSGKKPIKIERIAASCSCTDVTIDRTVLKPGESADVVAIVDLKNRQAVLVGIAVYLEGRETAAANLRFEAAIPQGAANLVRVISPRYLVWERGDRPVSKLVRYQVGDLMDIAWKPPLVTNPLFEAQVLPTENLKEWIIKVTPKQTTARASGLITPKDGMAATAPYAGALRIFAEIR